MDLRHLSGVPGCHNPKSESSDLGCGKMKCTHFDKAHEVPPSSPCLPQQPHSILQRGPPPQRPLNSPSPIQCPVPRGLFYARPSACDVFPLSACLAKPHTLPKAVQPIPARLPSWLPHQPRSFYYIPTPNYHFSVLFLPSIWRNQQLSHTFIE